MDWQRIHRSLTLDHTDPRLFDSYVEPVLLLFNKQEFLQEYYSSVGTMITEFIKRFAQKLEQLPTVGWSFSATGNFAKLFYNIFVMVKEPEARLECLKGLWYWAYTKNQDDVQLQLRDLLENLSIPKEVQTEFANYIVQSKVATRRLEVPYSELAKMNLPQSIRNAIIRKAAG